MNCAQCNSPLPQDGESPYVRCAMCTATMYVADSVVPYQRIRPQLLLHDAMATMKQWMAETASNLSGVAMLGEPRAYDFLFWSFLMPGPSGFQVQVLIPATPTPLRELRYVTLPALALMATTQTIDTTPETLTPSVSREAAWRQAGGTAPLDDNTRCLLVRIPLYEFPYTFDGRAYRVIVEGVTGRCLFERYPRKTAGIFAVLFAVCILAFVVEGWILWGQAAWLALAFFLTALPVGFITFQLSRHSEQKKSESDWKTLDDS